MKPYRLGIVGMGPSGLNAAIEFCDKCQQPFELYFFEKKEKPAKKLLATGNGRANLSHVGDLLPHYFGSVAEQQLPRVFADFGFDKTKALHESLGILYTADERGRIYPHSLNAKAVVDAYENKLQRLTKEHAIHIYYNTIIKEIRPFEEGYMVRAVGEGKGEYELDAIILACGGEASPVFGSDGDGKYLLTKLGVEFSETRPALCRLITKKAISPDLVGLKWDVALTTEGRVFNGELLFTKEGLSGPVALEASFFVGEALQQDNMSVFVNFCPEYSHIELVSVLQKLLQNGSEPQALQGFLPMPLVAYVYHPNMDVDALAERIQNCAFEIKALSSFVDAQVTVGGVKAQELNEDLSLIRFPQIYVCGELCDIVGDCGGYNLQWAFSSGLIVGSAAAHIK